MTGYLFVLPATLVVGVFGLFPIGYSIYMSLHRWRVRRSDFVGLDQYLQTVGDVGGFAAFLGGIALIAVAHALWTDLPRLAGGRPGVVRLRVIARTLAAISLLGAGVAITLGYGTMLATGDARFVNGLQRTFFYGLISVPIQIALALVIASLLFQPIRARTLYRVLFFLPYVTPAVAGAAVFRAIFSPREERLANSVVAWFGVEPQRWLFEGRALNELLFGPFLTRFGIELRAATATSSRRCSSCWARATHQTWSSPTRTRPRPTRSSTV